MFEQDIPEAAMDGAYAYVWEFQVHPGLEQAFERDYGPDGVWAQLFRQSPDYIGTRLLKDDTVPGRYLTVDQWRSRGGHAAFQSAFSAQYAQLDDRLEHLSAHERSLGTFEEIMPARASR